MFDFGTLDKKIRTCIYVYLKETDKLEVLMYVQDYGDNSKRNKRNQLQYI